MTVHTIYSRLLAAWLASALLFLAPAPAEAQDRQHLTYWAGTPQEIEVFKIRGREPGPTVLIIGGIQGDEPGGYLSADRYVDLELKRGNLIVVPRANFKSIVLSDRGPDGDMNRKFNIDLARDPDRNIVETLKGLMAESDLVLNLHDGSGFYRPTHESETANPHRYGQCIIADAEVFTHPASGRIIPLKDYAEDAVRRVNQDIDNPAYKFHFANHNTSATDSLHKEQRGSVTYYALTQLGIPAFGIETSKSLPSVEMKVYQHNLAVNAFLKIFEVEPEQPGLLLEPPLLSYLLVSVEGGPPLAVADGQTLQVARGQRLEVLHIAANYDRGLSVARQGSGSFNDLGRPLVIDQPAVLVARKDSATLGRFTVSLLPPEEAGLSPRLSGQAKILPPRAGWPVATPSQAAASSPPETDVSVSRPITLPIPPAMAKPEPEAAEVAAVGQVTGFILEVDGRPVELAPGAQLEVLTGSLVKMVDLKSEGPLPAKTAINLRGFVPRDKRDKNNGDDRGFTADTGRDMMDAFSLGQKGQVYPLNAEFGQKVLASASLKIVKPALAAITVELNGQSHRLKPWGRLGVPTGGPVTITAVELAGGRPLSNPRFTLGGKPFDPDLPQTLTMPNFNANLAVFNGEELAGKVTLVAK
ncbi:MAG: hypothetical protein LBP55_06490 [Candidatus Adiutrix sp.]|jgi:hypothetical protein|nr:hypothetical protein [Candidatus Adiutrix sp.]